MKRKLSEDLSTCNYPSDLAMKNHPKSKSLIPFSSNMIEIKNPKQKYNDL